MISACHSRAITSQERLPESARRIAVGVASSAELAAAAPWHGDLRATEQARLVRPRDPAQRACPGHNTEMAVQDRTALVTALSTHNAAAVLETPESGRVDFKRPPRPLHDDKSQWELAQDVASM